MSDPAYRETAAKSFGVAGFGDDAIEAEAFSRAESKTPSGMMMQAGVGRVLPGSDGPLGADSDPWRPPASSSSTRTAEARAYVFASRTNRSSVMYIRC
jgi:hypothetical protein